MGKLKGMAAVPESQRDLEITVSPNDLNDADGAEEKSPLRRTLVRASMAELARSDLNSLPRYKDLPQSIYGAAMMAAIRENQHYGVAASVVLALVLNTLMQVYVLYCTNMWITGPAVRQVNK